MWSLMPWKRSENSQNSYGGVLTAEPLEREFLRIRNDFDRLLQLMGGNYGPVDWNSSWMGSGFDETDTHYVLQIEAPGFEAGDFDVQASGDRLVVKFERKASEADKKSRRYSYGSLQRSCTLPEGAQADGIEAQYRHGILEVRIPKGPETRNVTKITVKST